MNYIKIQSDLSAKRTELIKSFRDCTLPWGREHELARIERVMELVHDKNIRNGYRRYATYLAEPGYPLI